MRFCYRNYRLNSYVVSAIERRLAFWKIVQIVQEHRFQREMLLLEKSHVLQPSIQSLNPFIHEFDDSGIHFKVIRVGGRLLQSNIPYDAKFPLLLPRDAGVKIFVRNLHIKNYHAGPKVLMALLRQQI